MTTIREKIGAGHYTAPALTVPRPKAPPTRVTSAKAADESRRLHAEYEAALPAYQEAMRARRATQNALDVEFEADALAELGLTGHQKAGLLYRMAHERSHSEGHEAVLDTAEDLAELLRP
jgi:hypothetical protein